MVLGFLLGPLVAALGLLALFIALRTRWRVRNSLYESLRTERRRQVAEARSRALSGAEESPEPAAPAEPEEVAVPEETLFQRVAAQLAMLGALLAILLGVLLLIAAAR